MQVAASQFAEEGQGHKFVLRGQPLAKPTAKKCAECGFDVFAHSRDEVDDADVLMILSVTADSKPSEIIPGLFVGGYKSVLALKDDTTAVCNCAGRGLHSFFPPTRGPFDVLRTAGRLIDLEWEDSEAFSIPAQELFDAVRWVHARLSAPGENRVLVNCAQGKSRSGTVATAYLMASRNVSVDEALGIVQAGRPLVEPNPSFLRRLRALEADLRQLLDAAPS